MDRDIKIKIKEKKQEKEFTNKMGSDHPAYSPDIILPRSFRWTLTSELHPDIHWWMKCVKTDYINKKIYMEVFDDAKGAIFTWLQAITNNKDNTLVLTHLNGNGRAISLINFIELKIADHTTDYDYGKSSVLTHKVVISYQKVERVNQLNIN